MCVLRKEKYWIKTHDAYQNLIYVEKYQYQKHPKVI